MIQVPGGLLCCKDNASRTQISICKSQFPSAGTAVSLLCA